MDELISKGKFSKAVEHGYADDAASYSNLTGNATSKKEKIRILKKLEKNIKKVNSVTLLSQVSTGKTSFSEFEFDFVLKNGKHLWWREIVRRQWNKDNVVEEMYFPADQSEDPQARVIERKVGKNISLTREVADVSQKYVEN